MIKFLLILMLICTPVFAVDECITIDTTGWTQDRQNMRIAVAVGLVHSAGGTYADIFITPPDDICFEDPDFTLSTILTQTTMLDRYNVDEAVREAARVAQQAIIDAANAELQNNQICTFTLDQATTFIDNNVTDLAGARLAFKKLAKYLVALRDGRCES